ncbi:MAG TPA: zinc-binding dehydrogenase, partial [Gemmatales bacterium]|nr:zinc-binding dehydrogenase [Gemmatales bacterium]
RCPEGMRFRHPPDVWPHFNAAYGQYYYLRPGQVVFKIPDGVPDDLAAPANCALAQVVYSMYLAQVGLGDHVAVQGSGGLGVLAAAVAKERGAASVIVIDSLDDRLQLAKEFGADHLIDMKQYRTPAERIQQVKKLTQGWGADVVLEVVGKAVAVPEGVEMLGHGGTYALVGCICAGDACSLEPASLVLPGKRALGIMWYDAPSLLFSLQFLAKYQSKYPFHKLVSHRYPLREIDQAFCTQDAGQAQRSALLPWE